MNKPNKRDTLNLVFSAFLVLGYIICAYFFLTMSATAAPLAPYINTVVFTVFGLIIFYATRVGEGKPQKRFSLWTLIIMVIPAFYAIMAYFVPALPLHTAIANLGGTTALQYSPLFIFACVALGYGIPYTFLSGFETAEECTCCENEDCSCECECCHEESDEEADTLCDTEPSDTDEVTADTEEAVAKANEAEAE